MTKQYLEDNLMYTVVYDDGDEETLSGKQIASIEERDECDCCYWYAHVNYMGVAKKQPTKELQDIADSYYKWLKETSFKGTWYSFLSSLEKEGRLQV